MAERRLEAAAADRADLRDEAAVDRRPGSQPADGGPSGE
jgi:hypothetical protein